ncbi:MAG: hypothetical protein MJ209_07165 [archaeon]|nr:hypothetical protein [archaeon]
MNLNKNKDIIKKEGKIIILQNGFGNDEFYLNYFNKEQVFCGRVIMVLEDLLEIFQKLQFIQLQ